LSQILRDTILRNRGIIFGNANTQLVCQFEDEDHLLAGYATAIELNQILLPLAAKLNGKPPQFALTEGKCLAGSYHTQGTQSFVYGLPIRQAMRLLQESNPGECVASSSVAKTFQPLLARFGKTVQTLKGNLSEKNYYGLPLSIEALLTSKKLAARRNAITDNTFNLVS
jgi:class 3 adenylate cyclase